LWLGRVKYTRILTFKSASLEARAEVLKSQCPSILYSTEPSELTFKIASLEALAVLFQTPALFAMTSFEVASYIYIYLMHIYYTPYVYVGIYVYTYIQALFLQ
jgi:hypothetical protein